MLMTEWNWDDAKEVWFEEGWEEGREKGREEGLEKGLEEGLEKGLEKGREEVQNLVFTLIEQGYTLEQVKAKLADGTAGGTIKC